VGQLQEHADEFKKAGIQLVGISYDSPEILKNLHLRKELSFPLLSDKDSEVITKYGVLNKETRPGRFYGIPHPTTILLDKKGVVQARLFVDTYKRHSPKQLLEAAEKADKRAAAKARSEAAKAKTESTSDDKPSAKK